MTFADYLIPTHPERKCHYNFPSWSVWRYPTKEERKKDSNIFLTTENQLFFYRPFYISDMNTDNIIRL